MFHFREQIFLLFAYNIPTMKRIILPLLTIAMIGLLAAGCKKDGGQKAKNYYIKYKANGNQFNWIDVFGDLGPHITDANKTVFGLKSWDNDEVDAFDIFLTVDGVNSITTGTYTFPTHAFVIDYKLYANTPSQMKYGLNQVAGMAAPQFSITFTSITPDEIKGTFTGNYLARSGTDEIIEITEGDFVIPRIR